MIKAEIRNGYVIIFSDEGLPIRKKGTIDPCFPNATERDLGSVSDYEEIIPEEE